MTTVSPKTGGKREALASLFSATSVAVVGASPREGNIGRLVVENLRALAPDCQVVAIGPRAGELGELSEVGSAVSLGDLDHPPEAVVIAVATERVVDVLGEAAELGTRAAVIFAGGFAEAGPPGRQLQEEIQSLAERHEMAILGPNCQGVVNFVRPLPLYSDKVDSYRAGSVALISQSGSVTTSLINNKRGVRWSYAVSSGNEACVDAADLLEYFLSAPGVAVICAFLETIRRPQRFFELCDIAREAGKVVVVCKTGRTVAAQRAAAAHSGALGSPDRLVAALLRRHGVIRTESLSEMLETAKAIASGIRPRGRRVAGLSGSGGHIELVLDEAEKARLAFPAFCEETRTRLHAALGEAWRTENPIDYWGVPNLAETLPRVLGIVASDPSVDILLGLVDFAQGPTGHRPRAKRVLEAWEHTDRHGRMLVLLDAVGGTPPAEAIEDALAGDVLVLSELATGLKAIAHLVELSSGEQPRPATPLPVPNLAGVAPILSESRSGTNSGELPLRLIQAAGIPVVPTMFIGRDEQFDPSLIELPFPVVVKIADPEMAHRAHRGGVVVGINSREELARTLTRLRQTGDGSVMIQTQLAPDMELLAGVTSSRELGSFVMVGVGGILTEKTDDVAIRPVGLRSGDPEALLAELRAHEAMQTHQSFRKAMPAIVDVIRALDQIGQLFGDRIQALEINPLMVTPEGCVAVDALLVVPSNRRGSRDVGN